MILLSFDIEEFDMPFEYGKDIPFEDQIGISKEGTKQILKLLDKHQVKVTFFSTVIFAQNAPELIRQIVEGGHELASHGYYHSDFETAHLASSKIALQELSGKEIKGYRMARMKPVDEYEITKAGYIYNSSINPTWLPGRYNNLSKPRKFYKEAGTWQVPASVSPILRFPLFWLSFHNLPLSIYQWLAERTHTKDGYLNIYFHPWEFTELGDQKRFGFPGYVSRNSGIKMIERMDSFIGYLKQKNYTFSTISDFL
ncbi:polysaccharide deacetylase family protein [Daejeonella sp.]|uniref:polysaccharide deacetylase family protein n=1 Tax=Daejeonella sp. TaxID=2805397 RepID=UPI0027310A39|nr:polysaccharide deacetylase family protein [Daejeonella sp.]MDP2415508.1 polysaccharide deacetylase family protein [Daejeonella sp.]